MRQLIKKTFALLLEMYETQTIDQIDTWLPENKNEMPIIVNN